MTRRRKPDTHNLTIQIDQQTSLSLIIASRAMGLTQDEFIAWAIDQAFRQVPRTERFKRAALHETLR